MKTSVSFLLVGLSVFLLSRAEAQTPSIEMKELGFRNESELSVVSTSGNSRSQAVSLLQQDGYRWDLDAVKVMYRYLRSQSGDVESARSTEAALRYERKLSDRLGSYVGQGLESDPYAGFDQRLNTDIGGKYLLITADDFNWNAEAGYRYTNEKRTSGTNNYSHFGRLYTEANWTWSPTSSSRLWIEYLPNFTRSQAFLLNTEPSVSSMLTSILSIKLSYLLKYTNEPPPGAPERLDGRFTTTLVAKF